jgi:hypothetical protein
LPPGFTAAVLVAFVVLALALAWRQSLQAIPWVATLAAVATALALMVATRDLVRDYQLVATLVGLWPGHHIAGGGETEQGKAGNGLEFAAAQPRISRSNRLPVRMSTFDRHLRGVTSIHFVGRLLRQAESTF